MLQSQLFPKTKKEAPKEAESANHKLLVRAGFIDQLMAGSWTLLPMGWRVVNKINDIIREEMNAIGGQEMLMPLLHPKSIWNETGRWDKADEIMYKLKDTRKREFVLSFTHEEIVMDLVRKHVNSHKDLPMAIYHFSTKFRNELRARGGILRGREFMMKDLYSMHTSEEDLMKFYEDAKGAYSKVFERLGFDYKIIEAAGGVFTDKNTHEFQVPNAGGEDTIYYCDECNWGMNKEIHEAEKGDTCPKCKAKIKIDKNAVELGNIFPLGTWYSERMRAYFMDEKGRKKPIWFGSYGIGSTRVLGALAEINNDEKGLIWLSQVAPFAVHLIELPGSKNAKEIYNKLTDSGVEILWDDRDTSAGEKFSDSDLIGIPFRFVVSDKTEGKIEVKKRSKKETNLVDFEEALAELAK